MESTIFSLNKGRNIIIIGKGGYGRSHIARVITELLKNEDNDKDNKKNYYYFICTEKAKFSDLIGYNTQKSEEEIYNGDDIIIQSKEGSLTKSIKEGKNCYFR